MCKPPRLEKPVRVLMHRHRSGHPAPFNTLREDVAKGSSKGSVNVSAAKRDQRAIGSIRMRLSSPCAVSCSTAHVHLSKDNSELRNIKTENKPEAKFKRASKT